MHGDMPAASWRQMGLGIPIEPSHVLGRRGDLLQVPPRCPSNRSEVPPATVEVAWRVVWDSSVRFASASRDTGCSSLWVPKGTQRIQH